MSRVQKTGSVVTLRQKREGEGRSDALIDVDPNGTPWMRLEWADFLELTARGALERAASLDPEVVGFRVRVPASLGRGTIDFAVVTPRISVMRFDAEFDQDFDGRITDTRMAKVRILLQGRLRGVESKIFLSGAGAFLETYPGNIGSSFVIEAGEPVRLLVLNCDLDYFTEEMRLAPSQLPSVLQRAFAFQSEAPQAEQTPLSLSLLRAANDIMAWSSDYPPALRAAFLDAKSREIVCAVVRQLLTTTSPNIERSQLSVRDVNRVHEARDVLAEQFRKPPSIPELARAVGVNQTKLKAAFKSLFGLTVNDFTTRCRMERASELLVSSSLCISEIAYAVGYDHPANFSIAFKRFSGSSPREARRGTRPRGGSQ